ncbi:hypothetical protein DERP_009624 [Dermatophagoides pteronyssinus]|uniref:Uncharacterized protein n=1 Tax=Dermatophagoides pteronyssinus TaxID=6956 RepID=A0ABQ8JAD8_DERPT|nr:hypothetical protein DERP_009624 [Dermatophagoides pteronyssinus]
MFKIQPQGEVNTLLDLRLFNTIYCRPIITAEDSKREITTILLSSLFRHCLFFLVGWLCMCVPLCGRIYEIYYGLRSYIGSILLRLGFHAISKRGINWNN